MFGYLLLAQVTDHTFILVIPAGRRRFVGFLNYKTPSRHHSRSLEHTTDWHCSVK